MTRTMMMTAAALVALGGLLASGLGGSKTPLRAKRKVTTPALERTRSPEPLPTKTTSMEAADAALEALAEMDDPTETLPTSTPAAEEQGAEPAQPREPKATAETRIVDRRSGAAGRLEGRVATAGQDRALRLEASFEVSGEALVVRYRVVNRGERPVYLLTPLSRYDFKANAWVVDGGRVYSRLRKDGTLELAKRLVAIPRGHEVYSPEVPYLTRLAPGSALLETLRVPLPLKLDDPYSSTRPKRGPRAQSAKRVLFSIAYLTDPSPKQLRRVARTERFEIGYSDARRQRILRSGSIDLPLQLR